MKAAEHNVAISGLAELVKILTAKMEGIDDSVADKGTKALEATIDSKVEARVRAYESDLRNQIAKLEAQINDSKNNADVNIAPDVATSKAYEDEDDGACSNDLVRFFIICSCYFFKKFFFTNSHRLLLSHGLFRRRSIHKMDCQLIVL